MKLTCVTAVFNAIKSGNRENLIRCVKSVAALKTEHEHLIYDGASTDGTVELLRELESKTPGLKVVSEPDTGIYNALNKGVRDARGEWFYVLGADDYICNPDVMDETIEMAGDAELLASPVARDNECYQFHKLDDLKYIFIHIPYCHQGVIAKTIRIRSFGGYDESYRISADGDSCFKFHLARCKVKYHFKEYANFAPGGTCEGGGVDVENARFIGNGLKASSRQRDFYLKHGFWSIELMIPFLFDRDYALRSGSRWMAGRWLRYAARFALYPVVILTRPVRHRLNHKN